MITLIKRPVGRPRKDGSPNAAAEKRPPGRPNHKAVNRYTGVRAQNINYVREYLRRWLEAEERGEHELVFEGTAIRRGTTHHYRTILLAVRLLLACEEIFLFENQMRDRATVERTRAGLLSLGNNIGKGEVKLPDLFSELERIEKDASDA